MRMPELLANTSVRKLLGIETRNSARASQLIAALKAGEIVPDYPAAAPKLVRQVSVSARAEDRTVT